MAASPARKQRAPRGRWSAAEKRRLVELTLREDTSVRATANEHGVSRTSLNNWRALYRAGKLGAKLPSTRRASVRSSTPGATFLPVRIVQAPQSHKVTSASGADGVNVVELTFSAGTRVRIETSSLNVVCALVAQLQR